MKFFMAEKKTQVWSLKTKLIAVTAITIKITVVSMESIFTPKQSLLDLDFSFYFRSIKNFHSKNLVGIKNVKNK